MISNLKQTKSKPIWLKSLNYMYFCIVILNIAPVNDPVNEPVNEPVSEPVNDVLKDILEFIKNNPGIKKPAIITRIGKSKATLTRYLKQLVEQNLIEYRGSDKTGGYYLKK